MNDKQRMAKARKVAKYLEDVFGWEVNEDRYTCKNFHVQYNGKFCKDCGEQMGKSSDSGIQEIADALKAAGI